MIYSYSWIPFGNAHEQTTDTFYNMEELIVNEVEETEIKIKRRPRLEDPTSKLLTKKEDDDDLEFIDFE